MPADRAPDPHADLRAALERVWLEGRRLSRVRRRLLGTLPTSPERLAGLDHAGEERVDAYLFRLGAALAALMEDILEPVLLAEYRFMLFVDVAEDVRSLQACGAIASADQVLDIRERVWRHHRIATLPLEARAAALNQAWADGQAMADLLAGLARHIQRNGPLPRVPTSGKERDED